MHTTIAAARHTKSFPLFPNHYFNISGLLPCCKKWKKILVLLWWPKSACAWRRHWESPLLSADPNPHFNRMYVRLRRPSTTRKISGAGGGWAVFFSERNRSILSASLSPRPILYGRIRPAVGVCFICNHLHIAPSANLRQHAGSQTGDIVHLHNISYVSSTYSNIPALGTVFKNA